MSQTSSSPALHCTRCDAPLPAGFKPGLCPVCLMDVAMHPTQDATLPAAPPQRPLTPAELAPHFPQLEILECIGRGGMGVVYKARQKALDRLVALKLLAPEQKKDAAFAERFAHEARALAALSHPNIVTVHDFGESSGFYYLLMEYVDGVNLRQAMRGSRLTPEQALAIVPPICEALQYAHDQGIVHRDIKPENLLLDKAGRVKIADFGIAKMMGRQDAGAAAGATAATEAQRGTMVAGTPAYMAPEQRSSATATRTDHRADIYSLGVVLYELLTGRLPSQRLEMAPQAGTTDARIDEIVRRALEQDPEQRYQTVKELQTHLATLATAAARPADVRVHSREKHERWFRHALRAAGVLCLLLAVRHLLEPVVSWSPLALKSRDVFSAMRPQANGTLLLWSIAAAVLMACPRWLARASYRPLILPPRLPVEIGGMGVRLAGLCGLGAGVAAVGDSWLSGHAGSLQIGVLLLVLGGCLFRFEHALAPIAYAVPGWHPLPYAPAPGSRRRLSGHAVAGALLLGVVMFFLAAVGQRMQTRLFEGRTVAEGGSLAIALGVWTCVAAVASVLGWAAVNLIRHSGGRLWGLGLASLAALALPLHLGFLVLTSLIYMAAANHHPGRSGRDLGPLAETAPDTAFILGAAESAAGLLCLLAWLWVWKRLRALPRAAAAPMAAPKPRTGFALTLAGMFGALLVLLYLITTYSLPAAPKMVEKQFSREVERRLNLRLFAAGYEHDLPQGTLRLPSTPGTHVLALPGLRDRSGRPVDRPLRLVRTGEAVGVVAAVPELKFTLSQRATLPLRQEFMLAAPQAGTRCLYSVRRGQVLEAPFELRHRLQSNPAVLTDEDFRWLREQQADLMVVAEWDGVAVRFFDGAAAPLPMSQKMPSGFDWLMIDDRELAQALATAFAAIPDDDTGMVVRAQSPTVLAFATRQHFGLIENLGPSTPESKDAQLRILRLPFHPFR